MDNTLFSILQPPVPIQHIGLQALYCTAYNRPATIWGFSLGKHHIWFQGLCHTSGLRDNCLHYSITAIELQGRDGL